MFNLYLSLQLYISSLLSVKCIRVQPGDRIGVYSQQPQSPFAYIFNASRLSAFEHSFANLSDPAWPGTLVEFDTLAFPYTFSVAAYYYVVGLNWSLFDRELSLAK
jgi:hypothetical protein